MLSILSRGKWECPLQFARCFLEKFGSNTAGITRGYRGRNGRDVMNLEAASVMNQEDGFFEEAGDLDLDAVKQIDSWGKKEKKEAKSSLKRHIIKKKYFKEPPSPNLMTWAEKQYMKYLHKSESEKWSIPALADNFGTTPDVVKKIIRANWTPDSPKDITKHDAAVARRRQALGLPAGTGTGSTSFAAELIPAGPADIDQPALACGEFSSLVQKSPDLKQTNSQTDSRYTKQGKRSDPDTPTPSEVSLGKERVSSGQDPEKDNFLIAPIQNRRRLTLPEYMKKLEKGASLEPGSKENPRHPNQLTSEPGVLKDDLTFRIWKEKQEATKQYMQGRGRSDSSDAEVRRFNEEVVSEDQELWNEFFQRGRISREKVYKNLSDKPVK